MSISELKAIDGGVPVKIWAPLHEVESQALTQLRNVASLPWVYKHVAAMPDVHLGVGATIGSVIAMKEAVSPSCCGVDIGCGMMAVKTNLKAKDLPDDLNKLRSEIERSVPVGFNSHSASRSGQLLVRHKDLLETRFKLLHPKVQDLAGKAYCQCGSLGGGNHFIEICLDTEQSVWIMLHSGSRNIGKSLAEIHISIAKKLAHNNDIPDPDLAVFLAGTPEMEAYRRDLMWAQDYALANREVMLRLIQSQMSRLFPDITYETPIQCHHNYVAEEVHYGESVFVTRKGAISAQPGQLGIIPGSMGTKSYIVEGLGNSEAFNSASHGAGRRFSRGEAKRRFTLEDLSNQTAGVNCRKDVSVLDEIPGAYKDIDQVMENQKDLVKIKYELKQILCVKG